MTRPKRTLLKWLAVGAVASGVVIAVIPVPHHVPSYEPIQYGGKDSLTPAQKAKFQQIYNFAVAGMERRHVSARKFNQFLWQMHFFVPVHYKPFDCSNLAAKAPLADRTSDFIAMGESMRDVHDAFANALPMVNVDAQAKGAIIDAQSKGGSDLLTYGLTRNDILQIYSWHLPQFMDTYSNDSSRILRTGDVVKKDDLVHDLSVNERFFKISFFDPYKLACGRIYFLTFRNGISANDEYTYQYEPHEM